MLQFAEYLEEAKKSKAASSEVSSDDKGKLHELLLGSHLNGGKLPEHFRAESDDPEKSGTPQQVHDKLRDKVGPEAYNEINRHAKQTADALVSHLKEHGHIGEDEDIHSIHWTSNRDRPNKAGDHETLTGVKDVNSNADLIITKKNKKTNKPSGFIGVSAKYGETKEPNYANPGLETLEKQAGAKKGEYENIKKAHNKRMEAIGYTGTQAQRHKLHKDDIIDAEDGWEDSTHRLTTAMNSSLEARKDIIGRYAKGIDKKGDSGLREIVRNFVSPSTHIPHVVAHSHVQLDGSAKPVIKDAKNIADDRLNNYSNLSAEQQGMSAVISGTNKATNKKGRVATISVKNTSGPHKGFAGTVKLG